VIADFAARLDAMAQVIVRVGVNLQPGQRLLVAEPYEQLGVARSAEVIVHAVTRVAAELESEVDVIWSDPAAVRQFVENEDHAGHARLAGGQVRRMERHVAAGGALLFLTGSLPRMLAGLPADRAAAFHRANWLHLGPLVQRLMAGETQWSIAPAPSPTWAALTFSDLPTEARLAALWHAVFGALRATDSSRAVADWRGHLATLRAAAERLNAQRVRRVHFAGDGTDLTVELPSGHQWCTAERTSRRGVPFVANLPTEEVFTVPDRRRVHGRARISRPIVQGGVLLQGVELVFAEGRVIEARAETGGEFLCELLATDDGAARLGEVALVGADQSGPGDGWQQARNLYHHPLLDENAAHHIALGEAYPFCHRGWWKRAVNRSAVHVDLPLAARATLA
jgi:aminopeptidase